MEIIATLHLENCKKKTDRKRLLQTLFARWQGRWRFFLPFQKSPNYTDIKKNNQ